MTKKQEEVYTERQRLLKGCLDKHFSHTYRMKLTEEMEGKTAAEKEEIAKRLNKELGF